MALIQDENSKDGNNSLSIKGGTIKGTHGSTVKSSRKTMEFTCHLHSLKQKKNQEA